jgi:hypothetical protein
VPPASIQFRSETANGVISRLELQGLISRLTNAPMESAASNARHLCRINVKKSERVEIIQADLTANGEAA